MLAIKMGFSLTEVKSEDVSIENSPVLEKIGKEVLKSLFKVIPLLIRESRNIL
jgi:hypothetical protein